jgi:hypothetical protein
VCCLGVRGGVAGAQQGRAVYTLHANAQTPHGTPHTRHRHAVGTRACTQVPKKASEESEWKIMPCSPSVEGCLQMSIMELASKKDDGLSPQPTGHVV